LPSSGISIVTCTFTTLTPERFFSKRAYKLPRPDFRLRTLSAASNTSQFLWARYSFRHFVQALPFHPPSPARVEPDAPRQAMQFLFLHCRTSPTCISFQLICLYSTKVYGGVSNEALFTRCTPYNGNCWKLADPAGTINGFSFSY